MQRLLKHVESPLSLLNLSSLLIQTSRFSSKRPSINIVCNSSLNPKWRINWIRWNRIIQTRSTLWTFWTQATALTPFRRQTHFTTLRQQHQSTPSPKRARARQLLTLARCQTFQSTSHRCRPPPRPPPTKCDAQHRSPRCLRAQTLVRSHPTTC